jgi:Protein of unknown function (DUF3099)
MRRSQELGFDDDGRPILITAAAPAYEVQHRQRVRKYLAIMSFRIPAWVAVLIANDRPPRRAEEPRRFDQPGRRTPLFPTAERPSIERRSRSAPQPESPFPNADGSE